MLIHQSQRFNPQKISVLILDLKDGELVFWKFKNGVKLKKEKVKMNLSEPKTENSNVPSMIFAIMSQTLAPISGLIFGYIPVRDHSFVIFVKKILSVNTIARNTC